MEKIPYVSIVSNLIYVQVCTCPNIAFVVNVFGRYLSNHGLAHWQAAKRVMRYLQGTKDYMLTYRRFDCLEVKGYTDFNYGGCPNDFKFTSDCIFMLAECVDCKSLC